MATALPAPLIDSFGRVARDLRISVTDRCNFRCTYCMPREGMQWLERSEVLSFEEITRLARVFVERFDFEGIRLTGGEPTVRAELPMLVGRLAALRRPGGEPVELSMTTNGTALRRLAAPLRRAGLDRVNVSCDSLRRDRFAQLTRRDELAKVLEGIEAAVGEGFAPVKVNVVLMRGVNDDELVDFASFGRERGLVVRFIEFMPLDADGGWAPGKVVPAAEVVQTIGDAYPLERVQRGAEPATRYRYLDGRGEIGVIASVTEAFCSTCDRVRLTAEGQFRTCLFSTGELDLRALLRGGCSDDDLADAASKAVWGKWSGHQIGRVDFIRPKRSMSQIGG
ncbi:MAG: GTP 3',8-cyclase MoaA [Acidimicrobiales bacterium]